jgi:hypothetical protein
MEGKKIKAIRDFSDTDHESLHQSVTTKDRTKAVVLEDGTRLVPIYDMNANRAGVFFGLPDDLSTLSGVEIESVLPMSNASVQDHDWQKGRLPVPPVITTTAGHTIYPSRDTEGTGPGVLYEFEPESEGGEVYVIGFQHERTD